MPFIFRFHKGTNNTIFGWAPSDRIQAADVRDVVDKTNIVSSSAGSSIPTPLARMFLFKTAFEIMSVQMRDKNPETDSIYAGLVSETFDLLELLFKSGGDAKRFRYVKWVYDQRANEDQVDTFFGPQKGHKLLSATFSQIARQQPFNGKIEIILIYYREGDKEVLLGGTSPFTFVFTTPNFRRKLKERRFQEIYGMKSSHALFGRHYIPLQEREENFVKYIAELRTRSGVNRSANAFFDYVSNCETRHPDKFHGATPVLQDIYYNDLSITAANIPLQQLSEDDFKHKVSLYSDFKINLPPDTHYVDKQFPPLFLNSNMDMDGQYTSPSNHWSSGTAVNALIYPETTVSEIMNRELPGITGFRYPFLSKFDIFERTLFKLPDYLLNDERFETLIENQDFILPIKPIFFYFFPLARIKEYVSITRVSKNFGEKPDIVVQVSIPIFGSTFGHRKIVFSQVYEELKEHQSPNKDKFPVAHYGGILGVFPFTRARIDRLKFTNKYVVAAYEKQNHDLKVQEIKFFKDNGESLISSRKQQRSVYEDANISSDYYEINESFDIIQLTFAIGNSSNSGVILPKFREIVDGKTEYVYAVDFGTSNTHIEFAEIDEYKKAKETKPFEVDEKGAFVTMLNKPKLTQEHDNTVKRKDFMAFGDEVDSVKAVLLREFMPFLIGRSQGATTQFPFRTAVYESDGMKGTQLPSLFIDANIGFNIERDMTLRLPNYSTDIKWQLESNLNDPLKQNRVRIFFRQLLLMIRTHALTNTDPAADLAKVRISMSYPISMDEDLRTYLKDFFNEEMTNVFNIDDFELSKRSIELKESLAPFYFLKKENAFIQNDVYGNIDIGGGTSDIILVKKDDDKNVLNGYCSSVKFAGQQLWGSVSRPFDPSDNGFLTFYLKHLQYKDASGYKTLENIISANNNRTQDLVSYLFNESSFKFKFLQIFTECKELKVPLLLHYAALLYYVAKFCKLVDIPLPRNLSFSGKGSEYIFIIFKSEDHLRSFSALALQTFSGLTCAADFRIIRTENPKAITAKGAAIFGANPVKIVEDDTFGAFGTPEKKQEDLQIRPSEKLFYGFADQQLEHRKLNYDQFSPPGKNTLVENSEYKHIMDSAVDFLEVFFNSQQLVQGSERSLGIDNLLKYKSFFLKESADFDYLQHGILRDSYKHILDQKVLGRPVSDPPFFFPFNTSLIELSKHIADDAIKKMRI